MTAKLEVEWMSEHYGEFVADILIYLDPSETRAILEPILVEARDIPSRRTRVNVEETREGIRLVIEAKDLTALRAALNSFLRFIDSCLASIRVIMESGAVE